MNGSMEKGGNRDRIARFQVRCEHEPGIDVFVIRGRGWQGRRIAQSRDDGVGIRKFACGQNGDARLRIEVVGSAAFRRGRRGWRMSATGPMQAGWSGSSRLKAGRWRSRGETGTGIAAHGRAARGHEREAMTADAITAEGRLGSRWSSRAGRWRAAPSRRRAELVLSRVREAHVAAARSVAPRCASGAQRIDRRADPQRRTDRLLVAESAPPGKRTRRAQAGAVARMPSGGVRADLRGGRAEGEAEARPMQVSQRTSGARS